MTINYTHLRFDGLFAGVALGWLQCFHPGALRLTNHRRSALCLCGLVLASGGFLLNQTDPRMYTVG